MATLQTDRVDLLMDVTPDRWAGQRPLIIGAAIAALIDAARVKKVEATRTSLTVTVSVPLDDAVSPTEALRVRDQLRALVAGFIT